MVYCHGGRFVGVDGTEFLASVFCFQYKSNYIDCIENVSKVEKALGGKLTVNLNKLAKVSSFLKKSLYSGEGIYKDFFTTDKTVNKLFIF